MSKTNLIIGRFPRKQKGNTCGNCHWYKSGGCWVNLPQWMEVNPRYRRTSEDENADHCDTFIPRTEIERNAERGINNEVASIGPFYLVRKVKKDENTIVLNLKRLEEFQGKIGAINMTDQEASDLSLFLQALVLSEIE